LAPATEIELSKAAHPASAAKPLDIQVAVSKPMRRLRDAQTQLNAMLWSTEICYGHVLGSTFHAGNDVWSLFPHARTQAWFPNAEGKLKYNKHISKFLTDVAENTKFLHRHVMINYYSQFEAYLADRLGEKFSRGPFVRNFAADVRLTAQYSLQPQTILLADLSRLIRNQLVHRSGAVPKFPNDNATQAMCATFEYANNPGERQKMADALQVWGIGFPDIGKCFNRFVGGVAGKCKKSSKSGGSALTHEFFYTLFTFTHFDNLAFEIEEALFDPHAATASLWRSPKRVRNLAMRLP